jgi:hypothetical protein
LDASQAESRVHLSSAAPRFGDRSSLSRLSYGWFTEGFDTPDLKDTKALLDELGGIERA